MKGIFFCPLPLKLTCMHGRVRVRGREKGREGERCVGGGVIKELRATYVQLPSFFFITFTKMCTLDGGLVWTIRMGGGHL